MKPTNRSHAAPAIRAGRLISLLALAALGCKKDATSPAAAGTKLAFTVQPTNAIVDSSIVPAVVVHVVDDAGMLVSGSGAVVSLTLATNPGGANLGGTATVGAVGGVATFPYLSVNRAATGYMLVATASGLASATSASFDVTAETNGPFASVSIGGNSTCGTTTAGTAYCWGNNSLGQLGNGASTNSTTPTKVAGGLTFGAVSVGSLQYFTCGLATSGAAYCWGYNEYGQLGNGTFTNSNKPVAVAGGLSFTAITAGSGGQACGLVSGGAAYCWGYNGTGQLGATAAAYSSTPLPVSGGLSFAAIAAGESGETCGVTTSGAAYCWGFNGDGELGNGSTTNANAPVAVSGGLTFAGISAGFASTCGVTTAGAAYCWGDNTYGELGNGSTASSKTPVAVSGGHKFTAMSVGDAFACGLTTSGAVYCWGYNHAGQLGNGTAANGTSPAAVLGGITFAAISAGYASACAVTPGGAAYCWGDNAFGELGNASTSASLVPKLVSTPP